MLENNHMKRKWNKMTEEIERLKNDNDQAWGDFNVLKSQYENVRAELIGRDGALELLERSLIEQGELLSAVTNERDRLYREKNVRPEKAT